MKKLVSTAPLTAIAAGAFLLLVGGASAAPTYCSAFDPNPNPDGLFVGEVTLGGANSDDCYGVLENVTGNPSTSDVNTAFGSLYGGGDFTLLWKDESTGGEAGSSLDGFTFDINADNFGTTGTYSLSWTGGQVPATFDFVIGLKASTDAALYIFDDELINTTPSSSGGTYEISFTNPGGQTPALSNITLFGREGNGGVVPEPASLGILGIGLIGLGWAVRRRKQSH